MKKIDFLNSVDIYTAVIPSDFNFFSLYPQSREDEILSSSNKKVKAQKYYAWKLLEYALKNSLGYDIKKINFNKTKEGKWWCKECYFSISHSHEVVVVAISKNPIGVDCELVRKVNNKAIQKVLLDNEKKGMENLLNEQKNLELLMLWSKKESCFKLMGGVFLPSKIDTTKYTFIHHELAIKDKKYILTACTELAGNVRFCENVNLNS